jgi:hypothetical protein
VNWPHHGSNKQVLVLTILPLQMDTLTGELRGQWSDAISLASTGKRLF